MDKLHRMQTHTDPGDSVAGSWFSHSAGKRINTDTQVYDAIKNEHPGIEVTVTPLWNADLKTYAAVAESEASLELLDQDQHQYPSGLKWTMYAPPAKRLDGGSGGLVQQVFFEKYLYRWKNYEFLVYFVDGRDSAEGFIQTQNQYILSNDVSAVQTLVATVGCWMVELHDQIWVFDQGFWQQDGALYQAIQKSSWDDIILDREIKEDLIDTIKRFFNSREQYRKLRVPWKRGMIFYGPPGNGKTVSIKATIHTLYNRNPPIPTLYVKSLVSWAGPEYSITSIFNLARREAPCYLVFEDLDSMITPDVRSFFLNAVDGLSENEGILMIGSTNHLELLDPGIAKRPSRFDRKYLFPDPDYKQRVKYCEYWQTKLRDNDDIEFPDKLNPAIAKITDGFSFAYIQEAFVSALLIIANEQDKKDDKTVMKALEERWEVLDLEDNDEDGKGGESEGLEKYLLYRKVKTQVEMLRKEISKDEMRKVG